MKNTLSITKNCICDCVDSVADGTNTIFVAYKIDNVRNPHVNITNNTELYKVVELVPNEINIIELPSELFTANNAVKFQYIDADYTGNIFTILFPADLSGNMTIVQNGEYFYNAKYTKPGSGGGVDPYELPIASAETLGGVKVGNNLSIRKDGTLDVSERLTNDITQLSQRLNDCFQYVSNGKAAIASAITDKGVETLANDTFQTMAENISKIETGIKGQLLAVANDMYVYIDEVEEGVYIG